MKRNLVVSSLIQNFRFSVSLGIATLSWDDIPEDSYFSTEIYRSTTNDRTAAAFLDTAQKSSQFIDNGLTSEVTYYYWALTHDVSGKANSVWSSDSNDGLAVTVPKVTSQETDVDSFFVFTKDINKTTIILDQTTPGVYNTVYTSPEFYGYDGIAMLSLHTYGHLADKTGGSPNPATDILFRISLEDDSAGPNMWTSFKQTSGMYFLQAQDKYMLANDIIFTGYEKLTAGTKYRIKLHIKLLGDELPYDVIIDSFRMLVKNHTSAMIQPSMMGASL